jgi:stage II sporulation protein AA (anti-sigma F factor antagonist)
MRHTMKNATLTIYLEGEIDHFSAKGIREEIETLMRDNPIKDLVLDFGATSFMDSAGIGLVIGRYRQMKDNGGKMFISNPAKRIDQILNMSGIYKIAKKI